MNFLLILLIAAGLGFIPASIAESKGYSFWGWWLYGWFFFLIALIHISLLPDISKENEEKSKEKAALEMNAAEELKKYKELLDKGVITEEEYQEKKKQLLEMI